jgi:hypothetical protein
MTRAELKTLMRSWLDDTSGGYFNDSNCNTWLNLAQRRVQMDLLQAGQNYYEISVETPLVIGQADYLFPADFITLNRLEVIYSGSGVNENRIPLKPITTNQQDMVPITSGNPTNYYLKRDRFTISPTPQSALTMRLYYSYRVADMGADSDVPDVPEHFMEYVAVVAAYDGFIKDDRAPENLMAKKKQYEDVLKKMASSRNEDVSRQIVITSDYDNFGNMF